MSVTKDIWVVASLTVLAGCRTLGPRAAPEIDDQPARDFVQNVCAAAAGLPFETAWLKHEAAFWPLYRQLYYRRPDEEAERAELGRTLGPRRDEMCTYASKFLAVAPELLSRMRAHVASTTGRTPLLPVVFTTPLQWTDGNVQTVDARDVLALNARHESLSDPARLSITIAHELFHDVFNAQRENALRELPKATRALFNEGLATWGTSVLFPTQGERVLLVSDPAVLRRMREAGPRAASLFLAALDRDVDAGDRFFRGGFDDPELPPRMGYWLGLNIFATLARERGVARTFEVGPGEFSKEVPRILKALAREDRP